MVKGLASGKNYISAFFPYRTKTLRQFGATDYISSGFKLIGNIGSGFFTSQTAKYQSQAAEAQAGAQAAIAAIAAGQKTDYTPLIIGGVAVIAGTGLLIVMLRRRRNKK